MKHISEKEILEFQNIVFDFYKKNKRSLPWRETKNPYHILVSEIMLQQTQAPRVVPFYEKWVKRFPNIKALAKANFSQIYPFWNGLGYNRRALALQKLAKVVLSIHGGILPRGILELEALPGIGPYTARAVSIFAYNRPITCIETNIRRVFIHHFFADAEIVSDQEILPLLELALPIKKSREWHWALMDYGSYLKSQVANPNRRHKNYSVQSKFEGSVRQIRGATLRILSNESTDSKTLVARIKKATGQDIKRIKEVILKLEKEGLIKQNKKVYSLN